jgi:6-phosphogluconolactonase
MSRILSSFSSLENLSSAAANEVIGFANKAIANRGVFNLALAGGSTPQRLYEVLSGENYKDKTDWSAWRFYFGDERIVPLEDARSNYAMARRSLLDRIPIKEESIHIPPVDLINPDMVAAEYEKMIRQNFESTQDIPRIDVILLGLGSDGHTASLFPGKSALEAANQLVVGSTPGILPPPVDRVTFTLPFINAARNVLFLAGGRDKVDAFRAAYDGVSLGEIEQVPANMVDVPQGDLHWFVTEELAAKVS